MFKMSEYSFVAGLLAIVLALLCYVPAFVLGRSARARTSFAGAGAGGGTITVPGVAVRTVGGQGAASLATYGTIIGWLAFAFLSAWLVFRTIAVGHGPFANMYEFSVSFAWGVLGTYLVFERRYHLRTLGIIALPVALGMLLYATTIPAVSEPLVPALQNNLLLTVHVAVAIVAYGGFSIAFGAALLYLVQQGVRDRVIALGSLAAGIAFFVGVIGGWNLGLILGAGAGAFLVAGGLVYAWAMTHPATSPDGTIRGLPRPEILDEISYRAVVVGFPFLTLVIVLGALWAEVAWGTYWNWDPKETASLVTWLIYGAYLHARVVRGWHGSRSGYLLLLGFYATVFTYFGNLFFGGLHSYAGLG